MQHYDLVVIGAGIHGAAVASEAAGRGYRVLVLEQFDGPARATSSKSSKLIHGGLRYLESGQFRLVRECLVERARLLAGQPDLVALVPFHIPVFARAAAAPGSSPRGSACTPCWVAEASGALPGKTGRGWMV